MQIGIIGAGGMGCLYGGRLAEAGYAVTLLDIWQEHVDAINASGLLLDGIGGERRIPIKATSGAGHLPACDLAIIFVDANSTREAAQIAKRLLSSNGYALTLQNGIGNVEALIEKLGAARAMGGLSYHSAALKGPGHVTHTHAGPTWLGERDGSETPRLKELLQIHAHAGLQPVKVDDITGYIWDKWVLNSAINPISAITGLRQGEIPRTPEAEEFQTRIIDEILAVIAAKGIRLHDPDIKTSIKDQCWKKFNKPSMQQHVEAGKRTEIDALNGAVVRLAREVGVPVPFNEALTMLIKGLEKSRKQAIGGTRIDYDALEAEASRTPRTTE
jgi:2-dehydropantoate 2-reductase